MRLLPFGRVVPVHCCCEPAKRLGWVPLPATRMELDHQSFAVTFVAGHDARSIYDGTLVRAERIHTEVARLTLGRDDGFETILAVKSAEQPIETWRKVPGFIEDRSADSHGLVCLPSLRPGAALRPGGALCGEGVPAAGESRRPGGAEGERECTERHEAGETDCTGH